MKRKLISNPNESRPPLKIKIRPWKIIAAVAAACVLLLAFFWYPAQVTYQIDETYTFSSKSAQSVQVSLAILMPMSGPGQTVSKPQIAWPNDTQTLQQLSPAGHPSVQIVYLQPASVSGQLQAIIRYQVQIKSGSLIWFGAKDEAFLHPSPGIESDAPEIIAQADKFGTGQDWASAFARYQYTANALTWPAEDRVNVEPSALEALRTGVGGCNEFANLLTALNRANGVPSFTISGLAFPTIMLPLYSYKATWGHPAGAHAWTAILTPQGWQTADASWASRGPDLFYFGRNDGAHLAYAEQETEKAASQELLAWINKQGTQIGAMTAPLKFAAAANGGEATVTPSVRVRVTQDGRWNHFILTLAVLILLTQIVTRFLRE